MYFDSITQFMRGRNANNTWRTPFDPAYSSHLAFDYVEGNAWQYTWLVPHDPKGLIGLFGSDDAFTKSWISFSLPQLLWVKKHRRILAG